jgi:hypothetical protein
MAKISKTEITQADLDDFIATEGDFDFEMQIANVFNAYCDESLHGGSYDDPVTNKARQFDIRSRVSMGDFHVRIAAECKNLQKNFPLLISRLPRQPAEAYHEILYTHQQARGGPTIGGVSISTGFDFFNFKNIRIDADNKAYPISDFVGKSTTQVGKNGTDFVSNDSEIFEKWAQALSSTYGLLEIAKKDFEYSDKKIGLTIFFPILVIPDDTLWCVDYKPNGAKIGPPQTVDHASIFIDKKIGGKLGPWLSISHIDVFTKKGIETHLNQIKQGRNAEIFFPIDEIGRKIDA